MEGDLPILERRHLPCWIDSVLRNARLPCNGQMVHRSWKICGGLRLVISNMQSRNHTDDFMRWNRLLNVFARTRIRSKTSISRKSRSWREPKISKYGFKVFSFSRSLSSMVLERLSCQLLSKDVSVSYRHPLKGHVCFLKLNRSFTTSRLQLSQDPAYLRTYLSHTRNVGNHGVRRLHTASWKMVYWPVSVTFCTVASSVRDTKICASSWSSYGSLWVWS